MNNKICHFVFIKKALNDFVIIAVYVDDMNIIGTPKELDEARSYLMKEFEMKDLGQTKYCLGLQIEHLPKGVFLHQSNYVKKVLENIIWINLFHLAHQWWFNH